MTDTWDDEKIASVVGDHGLEIYGFWWRLLEIIGKQMDGTGRRCSATYSAKTWGKFAGISAKKFQKFAGILEEKKIISTKNGQNEITVEIPNLLKYRDEWSRRIGRNSGVAHE